MPRRQYPGTSPQPVTGDPDQADRASHADRNQPQHQEAEDEYTRRRRRKRIAWHILGAVALLAIVVGFIIYYNDVQAGQYYDAAPDPQCSNQAYLEPLDNNSAAHPHVRVICAQPDEKYYLVVRLPDDSYRVVQQVDPNPDGFQRQLTLAPGELVGVYRTSSADADKALHDLRSATQLPGGVHQVLTRLDDTGFGQ